MVLIPCEKQVAMYTTTLLSNCDRLNLNDVINKHLFNKLMKLHMNCVNILMMTCLNSLQRYFGERGHCKIQGTIISLLSSHEAVEIVHLKASLLSCHTQSFKEPKNGGIES